MLRASPSVTRVIWHRLACFQTPCECRLRQQHPDQRKPRQRAQSDVPPWIRLLCLDQKPKQPASDTKCGSRGVEKLFADATFFGFVLKIRRRRGLILPSCIRSKPVVDLVKAEFMGDHRVYFDLAVHIPIDNFRHIRPPGRAAQRPCRATPGP